MLSNDAKKIMMDFEWKGNILQLDSFVERLILTATGRKIEGEKVKELLDLLYITNTFDESFDIKAENIRNTLKNNDWNRELTAKALGISKATLWRRMKKYNIEMK